MTNPGAPDAQWMTLPDVVAATGLPPAHVTQFVPATNTFEGPRYDPFQVALARVVRRLTSEGAPEGAIYATVADLSRHSYADVVAAAGPPVAARAQKNSAQKNSKIGLAVGALAALVVAGLIGGFIGAVIEVPTQAKSGQVRAEIPASPDAVCAEWAVLNDNYLSKRAEWAKTDPTIPATQWSDRQRSLSMSMVPVIKANATDLERLGSEATNPVLKVTLQMQALYMNLFAERLPNYTPPEDQRLWQASTDFGNASNSMCYAMTPK